MSDSSRRSRRLAESGARPCEGTCSRLLTPASAPAWPRSRPRLRSGASACEAAYKDGFEWPPAQAGAKPPYELQPGSGRRGPEELWARFDEAVAELDRVGEGRSIRAVGRAYAELADVAAQLAGAVEREDGASGLFAAVARRRGRSV
jgi:hypothetical protein